MKILFCIFPGTDYGHDTLFDGLCQAIGPENVIEYQHKDGLHQAGKGHRYPSYFSYPVVKTDDEKLKMVENGEFDYIFMAVRSKLSYEKPNDPRILLFKFAEVVSRNKNTPYVLVDQSDTNDVDMVAVEELRPIKYFKREYFKKDNWPEFVVPLTFGFSTLYCPEDINLFPRINDYFWAGKEYANREPFLRLLRERRGSKFYEKYTNEVYSGKLLKYKFGISLHGYGQDTVRYYEVPAHGMMLLSQNLDIEIENGFVEGESAAFFGSPEEMIEKLDYYIAHPDEADRIRMNGHEIFKKYHTTKARAEQLLAQLK